MTGRSAETSLDRLLLLASGSTYAAMLPYWLRWLRTEHPNLEVRVGLTPAACAFVTPAALRSLASGPITIDSWEGPAPVDHVELAEWPQAMIVYPSSARFIARLSLGLVDSPFVMAAACTESVVGVAPNVPPGMTRNPAYQSQVAELRNRVNVVVAPTHEGRSLSTGKVGDGVAGPLSEVLDLVLARMAASTADMLGTQS